MKSEQKKNMKNKQRGNAMVYILVALALFGGLTVVLGRLNSQSDSANLDDEMAELRTMELLSYIGSAQKVTDQMIMTGTEVASIDTVLPTGASFNISPHYHKLFHPQGGGLLYQPAFAEDIETNASAGWYIQDSINIEWTESTANDLVLSALHVSSDVCTALNTKMGVSTPPVLDNTLANFFDPAGADADLMIANCANCEGYIALCVEDSAGEYGYYHILQGL